MTEDADRPLVVLSDRQDLPANAAALLELARRTLRAESVVDAELSVSLVDEAEMEALHQRYAGEPGATDVLAFPIDDRTLGDVVICPAVAAREDRDLEAELRLLLVHGILHLLGYDHEEEDDRREMWRRQEAYSGVRVP